jgi:hypothetical protein
VRVRVPPPADILANRWREYARGGQDIWSRTSLVISQGDASGRPTPAATGIDVVASMFADAGIRRFRHFEFRRKRQFSISRLATLLKFLNLPWSRVNGGAARSGAIRARHLSSALRRRPAAGDLWDSSAIHESIGRQRMAACGGKMVRGAGFEPATPTVSVWCSTTELTALSPRLRGQGCGEGMPEHFDDKNFSALRIPSPKFAGRFENDYSRHLPRKRFTAKELPLIQAAASLL